MPLQTKSSRSAVLSGPAAGSAGAHLSPPGANSIPARSRGSMTAPANLV